MTPHRARPSSARVYALLNVLGTLAGAKLDDPQVGETVLAERILSDDGFDLSSARTDGQDDSAVARDLAARDQEMPGGIVFLQEL